MRSDNGTGGKKFAGLMYGRRLGGEAEYRVQTRSTRDHRPMLGDYGWSCGSWSLYSATGNIPMALSEAIIATYLTIHLARSPVHTVGELRLLARVLGGSGKSCRSPATKKGRCRLHGGAAGSGGPPGEPNGQYRHGERTNAAIAERQKFSALLKMLRAGLT